MKIAVCGKGGSGKSTIAALLAEAFGEHGKQVLVLDSDESNAGLFRMLGFDRPPTPLLELAGGKERVRQHLRVDREAGDEEPGGSVLQQDRIRISDIPPEFILRRGPLALAAIGKIHQALEGCACPMGVLTREFLKRLELTDDGIAIVDMEAGVEHFGRGVETSLDTVLAVVEPSLESILLATRIRDLAVASGAQFAGVLMNKTREETVRKRLASELAKDALPLLGVVRYHPDVAAASLAGRLPKDGPWRDEVLAIIDSLEVGSR